MYDNYNYPVGADTPKAPWNQEETPIKSFNVLCSQTLSKEVDVKTNDYIYEKPEKDEDGNISQNIDTSDTNWVVAYGMDHYTPRALIWCFKRLLNIMMEEKNYKYFTKEKLKELVDECTGWSEDETIIDGSV